MKNIPYVIAFSAFIGLVLLAVFAAMGISLPFAYIASDIVGFSCAAGVLSFLIMDYAPRGGYQPVDIRVVEPKLEIVRADPPAADTCGVPVPIEVPFYDEVTLNLMSTFGASNDPATVSMS
jgi:hypothetical protein